MTAFDVIESKTSLDIFWIAHPDSINAEGANWDSLAHDFLTLVGNSGKKWRLIISIGAPTARANAGLLNPEQLYGFLKRLKQSGVVPSELGYHPDFQGSHDYPIWKGWGLSGPSALTVEALAEKSVEDFNLYNSVLSADPSIPNFTSFHIEGHFVQKDSGDFAYWASRLNDQKSVNKKPYIDIYATGNWAQGIFANSDGVIQQIYNFGAPNPYAKQPTDPAKASSFGGDMFSSLQKAGPNSKMNSAVFSNPSVYPQVYSWNWDNTDDAPVFNPSGTLNQAIWTNDQFEDFLGSYSDAFVAYSENPNRNRPVLGVWAAEYAVPQLANNLKSGRPLEAFSAVARSNELDVLVERYQQDIILVNEEARTLDASVFVNCAYLNGIGLYPLLDASGRIASASGAILSPEHQDYLAVAKSLSQDAGLWHVAGAASSKVNSYQPVLQANSRYAIIADSQVNQDGGLSSSLRAANPSQQIYIAPDSDRKGLRIGFEDSITGDQDFNDLGIELSSSSPIKFQSSSVFTDPMIGDRSVLAPQVDVLWQGITALDRATAYQVAQLIAGNPKNNDLELVINISGPSNTALVPSPESHQDKGFKGIYQTPAQLTTFLNNVDFYVERLGSSWQGHITYHPLATIDEEHNWLLHSGVTESGQSYTLDKHDPYKAYIDYMGVLNEYLAANQTNRRQFSKLLLEAENSRYQNDQIFQPGSSWRTYTGLPAVFGQSGKPALQEMNAEFVATGGPTSKWSTSTLNPSYWHSDEIYAQFYDLPETGAGTGDLDVDYPYTAWNKGSFEDGLAPVGASGVSSTYTPEGASKLFVDFSVNKDAPKNGEGGFSPRKQTFNLHQLLTPDSSDVSASTSFNSDAHFIFSYGPHPTTVDSKGLTSHHTPVFQSGTYSSKNSDSILWKWDHDQFSSFITNFRSGLPSALKGIADEVGAASTFVSEADKLSLGVWAAELALDAWFDVPTPSQLPKPPALDFG